MTKGNWKNNVVDFCGKTPTKVESGKWHSFAKATECAATLAKAREYAVTFAKATEYAVTFAKTKEYAVTFTKETISGMVKVGFWI